MSGYRFLKVGGAYGRAITQFYARHPGLNTAPYQEQYQKYIETCIDFSDFYGRNLNKLGWDAIEIISTAEPMQKQWAQEHDLSYDEDDWQKQILSAQVKYYKPEILYWGETDLFEQSFRLTIRNDNPGIILHIGFKCSPISNYNSLRDLDLILTCTPTFIRRFKHNGLNAVLLHHAFEKSMIEKVGQQKKVCDFTFTGSLGSSFHTTRNDMVEDLLMSTPLEVWSFIKATDQGMRPKQDCGFLAASLIKIPPQIINRIPIIRNIAASKRRQPIQSINDRFPGRVHDEVFGVDMYRLLARSKIALNIHVDAAGKDAGSMRMFEATGMGSLLLTDHKNNIQQLFEPGKEVVVFRSSRECANLVSYYLEHNEEREAIANAGQQRTLNQHTYYHRAQELIEILHPMLSNRSLSKKVNNYE